MAFIKEIKYDGIYLHHSLTEHPNPENTSFKAHFHDRYELYYFISGSGYMAVEGNRYNLTGGDYFLMMPGETHSMHIDFSVPYERYAVLFKKEIFKNELSDILLHLERDIGNICICHDDETFVKNALQNILESGSTSGRASAICNLAAVLDRCKRKNDISELSEISANELVRDMIRYINHHISEPWNLDSLAKEFYHDKAYLCRCFKEEMGIGIWNYTLKKRVICSRQNMFLQNSVAAGFASSGFTDYTAYYRQYKALFHMSPSEDLKEYRNQNPR